MQLLGVLSALAVLASTACASKILVVVPLSARSHVMLFEPLVEELARRGHQVTYVAGIKMKKNHENIEELVLPPPPAAADGSQHNFFEFRHFTAAHNVLLMPMIIKSVMESVMESEPMQKLLKEDRHYDTVIVEAFLSEAIAAGLAHKFNAPLIGYGTFMPSYWVNYMVGNEAPASYIPDPFTSLPSRMTFLERLYSLVFNVAANGWHQSYHLAAHDALMRRYFGDELPPVGDMMRNTSLLLVNDHYSISFPRPAPPNLISIAGLHVKPPKPLPSELKQYLDSSKKGAILFSLGSNLQSSLMDPEKIKLFLEVFGKLEQNVLWKFEQDLPNKPKNVMTSDWLPQSDILAHPNVKLFITHGGLLSTTEAVDRGVPVVGIPIFGDQPMNMRQSVNAGVGLSLEYDNLTHQKLIDAINEVLNNPKYKSAAMTRSIAMKDVVTPPLQLAAWWVEYVIRHKGAPHLRSAGQHLAFYQRDNIDVILTIALASLLLIRLLCYLVCSMVQKLCGGETNKDTKKGKKD